jgi:1-aminocyclopropane-1-carboxylate deaminase/D-cysteine desulfhydrase-like pyridoxal-dependent ACC family enzyme
LVVSHFSSIVALSSVEMFGHGNGVQASLLPTPVHRGTSMVHSTDGKSTEEICFFVKREDLSSSLYGGNKVRSLQHQLAVIESKMASGNGPEKGVVVMGSGGSNQVVATVVHGLHTLGIPCSALWMHDPPDFDNALNMLSTLSFPVVQTETWVRAQALSLDLPLSRM